MKKMFILILCLLVFPASACALNIQTSAYMDYEALVSDPETYSGETYFVSGDVIKVHPFSDEDADHKLEMILVSIDGNFTKPAYIVYYPDDDADPFCYGTSVWAHVYFMKSMPFKTSLGFYMTLPVFYSPIPPCIQDE